MRTVCMVRCWRASAAPARPSQKSRRALALDPASSVLDANTRGRCIAHDVPRSRSATLDMPSSLILLIRDCIRGLLKCMRLPDNSSLPKNRYIRSASMRHENPERSPRFAALYAWRGQSDRARRILRALELPDVQARPSIDLALAYLKLGNRDRGYYWLGKSFDERGLVNYIQFDPRFDIVRGDPRFRSIVGRLNVPDPS